jgi:hypothetical protein
LDSTVPIWLAFVAMAPTIVVVDCSSALTMRVTACSP